MSTAASTGFKVISPGVLSLIQDSGRFGYHGIGLTNGGPLDPQAFYWANRLCESAAKQTANNIALEISVGGLVLESEVDTVIAVTGADMALTINGNNCPLWRSHTIKAGDHIELGYAQNGCRSYLAVAGGFDIAHSFGSAATVTREAIGGLDGERVQQGDLLPCHSASASHHYCLDKKDQPVYSTSITARVILGYQQQTFSDVQKNLFFSSEYTVSDRCDRMGYRLTGQEINSSINGILSEGICHGAIQIPADGQPIVLINDRQTIGGYPKIGSMISTDTARLAQLLPGGKVAFEAVSMERAHNLLHFAEARLQQAQLQTC
ncbi:biotin-dependent carboxyltransferase family protein [Oceanicoccus sagamiensis]|uniref:Allophanate hydrolase n=1 Tax=Oceanicoccus sagamiensis TaxID=716816 RepID=A0A1X9N3V1_9GAMM|nr:biotin-dependent carboxyltransferase family protein [Oceanicoccus sagamiensis]ARN72850.1 allophanate hydrolase [Oceanicoccus sagamiensis]